MSAPSIGERLREAREDRSLSIEESAWRTRLRPETLRALEFEDFDVVGNPADVRSHLSSYARFLGIDPSPIVGEFEARHGSAPSAIEALERREREAKRPKRPRWIAAALVSALLLGSAGIVGLLGGSAERPAPEASAPAPVPVEPESVPAAEARVRITLAASAPTTVGVWVDGRQVFEGSLGEGSSRSFNARDSVEVVAADAGAIEVTHNGESLGVAGAAGETFRARYGPGGLEREPE